MWPRPLACALLASLLLTGLAALAQTSRRRIGPRPPAPPSIFDQMERERDARPEDEAARKLAAGERRRAERAHLTQELPQLVSLAQDLRRQLDSTDLDTVLPVSLHQQSRELEKLARQVRKRIRNL